MSYVLANEEWAKELDWMIKTAEDKYKVTFPAGYNHDLQCIRLNLDPVQAIHRPLFFYLGLYFVTTVFNSMVLKWWWQFKVYGDHGTTWGGALYKLHQSLLWLGALMIGHHKEHSAATTTTGSSKVVTSEIAADDTDSVPCRTQRIVYWYRTASTSHSHQQQTNANTKTPIVFIHGIGAGLLSYVEFLYHMLKLNRPMMLVELPYVSMRMVDDVPDAHIVVEDIKNMLHAHGYEHAVFVSHSLGTGVTSWLMTNAPSVVAGTILIDPICFLLHYPQVCFNFIHRLPKRLFEYIMYYGASRELYISHYISRHFQWFQCIYFADTNMKDSQQPNQQSPLNNATVFLSEADGIVGSPMVSKYLAACGVDYRMMPGLEHAGFLFNWTWRKQILDQIDCVARNVDDEGVDFRS
ncbi:Alpha/Beta hydrolase protein [Absidia repens]|uniref:Alpha/Beta hydrolase protein n=1 Tax=Absidia repens TaxID=90262 RepID=A0A1X2IUA4_9FUNG|nr:Alpha/Beta hydrolase protein [Absidia repens]